MDAEVESAGADGGGGGGAASAAFDGHEGAARIVLKVPTPTEERRSRREGRVAAREDEDGDDPEYRGRGRGASSALQPPARRASDIGRAPPWSRWSFTGGPGVGRLFWIPSRVPNWCPRALSLSTAVIRRIAIGHFANYGYRKTVKSPNLAYHKKPKS